MCVSVFTCVSIYISDLLADSCEISYDIHAIGEKSILVKVLISCTDQCSTPTVPNYEVRATLAKFNLRPRNYVG